MIQARLPYTMLMLMLMLMRMRRHLRPIAALLAAASASWAADGSVTAAMAVGKDPTLHMRCGPIPLELSVANTSDRDVNILWNYPDIPGVRLQITGNAGAAAIQAPVTAVNRHLGSTTVKAHADYHVPVYVTRYWSFAHAGTADIAWTFDMTEITEASKLIHTHFTGTLSLAISDADPAVLEQVLARDQARMLEGGDGATREWALQEICSIRHPLAIPYFDRLATDASREFSAAQALMRFGDQPEAGAALRALMLKTSQVSTVEVILGGYAQQDRMPSDADLKSLLASPQAAIRRAAVAYLERLIISLPIDRVRELAKDGDANVSQSAKDLLKRLRNRVEGQPLDAEPRPVEDAHANKF